MGATSNRIDKLGVNAIKVIAARAYFTWARGIFDLKKLSKTSRIRGNTTGCLIPRTSNMKILLAEDARSVVQVMTSRLTSYGYDVVHAENGQLPSTSHSCLFSTTVSFHDG